MGLNHPRQEKNDISAFFFNYFSSDMSGKRPPCKVYHNPPDYTQTDKDITPAIINRKVGEIICLGVASVRPSDRRVHKQQALVLVRLSTDFRQFLTIF